MRTFLFTAESSIYFNQTPVDKSIVDAESVGIHNLINRSEAIYGCFAVNVLPDFLRHLFYMGCQLLFRVSDSLSYYAMHCNRRIRRRLDAGSLMLALN